MEKQFVYVERSFQLVAIRNINDNHVYFHPIANHSQPHPIAKNDPTQPIIIPQFNNREPPNSIDPAQCMWKQLAHFFRYE